jgi:signal transduction histidine kinase
LLLQILLSLNEKRQQSAAQTDALGSILQGAVQRNDLVEIRKIVQAFESASPGVTACVGIDSIVQITDNSCDDFSTKSFVVPLSGEDFKVGIKFNGTSYNLILSVVIVFILVLLAIALQLKVTAISKDILSDVKKLVSVPNSPEFVFDEMRLLGLELSDSQSRLIIAERDAAIARTTAALAHDCRKPFTMFKMLIDAVEAEQDPQEAKGMLKECLPEVQQAMASVNGMIADVLEIGAESAPIMEPANPETLIEAKLNEIFRVYPESKVNVSYALNHTHKVDVDTLKIGRVFSNIVGNAVQAMGMRGVLWFNTSEVTEGKKKFIRFCLGNGGSFIPEQSLPRLFDVFFTSGKKGGTGLGLAIALKIVTAHGGRIWCESDSKGGGKVEFLFTLPCSNELADTRDVPLPKSSGEIVSAFERLRRQAQAGELTEHDPLDVSLEKEIIHLVQEIKTPLKVLIADDEGVYRNSLASLVNRSDDLKKLVKMAFALNGEQAILAAKDSPALIILDVDLGQNSVNGYGVLAALRREGFGGFICIHSNRTSPEDYKAAVAAGADAVLPKPMSRTHFLKLALQAMEQVVFRKDV